MSTSCRVVREYLDNERVVWTVDSQQPGPVIVFTANIHGDECTGVAIINQLLEMLEHSLRAGQVRLFPSLNPEGLKNMVRECPKYGQDLNRLFPNCLDDSKRVHPALRQIWQAIQSPKPDLVVDLHSDSGLAMPYVIVDRLLRTNHELMTTVWDWADQMGVFTLWEYGNTDYRRFQLQRSLSGAVLNALEIPCVTLEIGRRRHVDPQDVQCGLAIVGRVLVHAGCLEETQVHDYGWEMPVTTRPAGVWRRGNGPVTRVGGMVVPMAQMGEILREGDSIARIIDFQGKTREIVWATETCIVIAYPDRAWVNRWASICTVALLES